MSERANSDSAPGPTDRPFVVAALLAAGGGRRFEGTTHKLLAGLPATTHRPAEPVVARSLAHLVAATDAHDQQLDASPIDASPIDASPVGAVIVVTGAADIGDGIAPIIGTPHRVPVSVVHNDRWSDGQATSVQRAIDVAADLGADIVIVGLADQPDVTSNTWRAVAAAATEPDAAPITVATYDGRPRNPVALHRSVWSMLPVDGDSGARDLIRLRPDLVRAVRSSGSPADIDTVEDLARWLNS